MLFLRKQVSLLLLSVMLTSPQLSLSADIGYQGSHILTHGTIEELAEEFQKKYGVHVFVKGGGCADGIATVVKGRSEMGGLCCPLQPEKAKKFGLVSHRVAVDLKSVIVNPRTGVMDLTLKQVSDIHKGVITNWKQVGGKNRPIALIFRDHCRDMAEPVRKALGITGPVAKKAIIVKTDQEIVEYVERLPSAIGVVTSVFAEKAKVRVAAVDGVAPTPENAEKGLYPIIGDMYIITRGAPSGWTRSFIEFVLSEEGQTIIGRKFARVK